MQSKMFSALIIGENAEERIKKFNINEDCEPRVVFYFKDKDKLYNNYLKTLKAVIDMGNIPIDGVDKEEITKRYTEIKNMTPFQFYLQLSQDLNYYFDDKTGNAMTIKKENGWSSYKTKGFFINPFILTDTTETFSAIKKDIDWEFMGHKDEKETYKVVWETVIEHILPHNDIEQELYENMKDKTKYLETFQSKENYILFNTAFWTHAVIDENDTWHEVKFENQSEWIITFFNKWIMPLEDNTKLTLFECYK